MTAEKDSRTYTPLSEKTSRGKEVSWRRPEGYKNAPPTREKRGKIFVSAGNLYALVTVETLRTKKWWRDRVWGFFPCRENSKKK